MADLSNYAYRKIMQFLEDKMTQEVPDRLHKLARLYQERNAVYGDDYKRHGDVMIALFPEGIRLETVADFNRYAVLTMIVAKVGRYASNFAKGGHPDSLDDVAVYTQMLQELDAEWRELYTISDTFKEQPCGLHTFADGRMGCLECDRSWDTLKAFGQCPNGRDVNLKLR